MRGSRPQKGVRPFIRQRNAQDGTLALDACPGNSGAASVCRFVVVWVWHPVSDDREGVEVAAVSIVIKTGLLGIIMVTGSIWEKRVSGWAATFLLEDGPGARLCTPHT